jgi:hypothetical protein
MAMLAVLIALATGHLLVISLVLGGLGVYVLYGALQTATRGRLTGGGQATYWRGQRIDLDVPRRRRGPTFEVARVWPRLLFGAFLLYLALWPYLYARIPWYVSLAVVAAVGGFFAWAGWIAWGSADSGVASAKYWRGQRIEPKRGFQLPPFRQLVAALIPLLIGVGLVGLSLLSLLVTLRVI